MNPDLITVPKTLQYPCVEMTFSYILRAFLFLLLPPGAINNLIMFWNSQFVYRGRAVWYLASAKLLKMVSEREALEREPLCCLSAAGLILLALLGTRSPVNLRLRSNCFLRVGSLCARSGGPTAETAKGLAAWSLHCGRVCDQAWGISAQPFLLGSTRPDGYGCIRFISLTLILLVTPAGHF